MENIELKKYAEATQVALNGLNANLQKLLAAVQLLAANNSEIAKQTAVTHDLAFLGLRAVAEKDVEFRTMLLRLCHEPATVPAAQEAREALKNALGEVQKILGERPSLGLVPPAPK